MITLKGRDILTKYLVGQVDSYASHIAIGCGSTPTTTAGNYQTKTELDFEMGRFPITSRSIVADTIVTSFSNIATTSTGQTYTLTVASHKFFVGQKVIITNSPTFSDATTLETYTPSGIHTVKSFTPTTITVNFRENGSQSATNITTTSKAATNATITGIVKEVSLTAELPYSGRYEITELGLYSYGDNPYITGISSQIISNFLSTENWKLYDTSLGTSTSLTTYSTIQDVNNNISIPDKAFRTNSDNVFFNSTRVARQERPRFLQDTIILAGDMSDFTGLRTATGKCLTLNDVKFNFAKNTTSDEIRVAYSLINKTASPTQTPKALYLMLEFITSNGGYSAKYQITETDANSLITVTTPGQFYSSRYQVKTFKLSDMTIDSGFFWDDVYTFRIWAGVEQSTGYAGSAATDFAIALDAIRFENKSNTNPNYGLVGYTVVNSAGIPLIKNDSMTHQVEFRYLVGETDNV